MIKITNYIKKLGAFGAGMLIGTCYGAVVASVTAFFAMSTL